MRKVLIVEDDVDTLDLVEYILRENGYAVIKINREITIKEITGLNPNLMIIDFLLPYGLGSKLCLEIKTNESTSHIPVILYSASSNIATVARESLADAYISKPFDIKHLVNVVNLLAL